MKGSFNGNGNDARIVIKGYVSRINFFNVTVTERLNGLRVRNPNPSLWSIFILRR